MEIMNIVVDALRPARLRRSGRSGQRGRENGGGGADHGPEVTPEWRTPGWCRKSLGTRSGPNSWWRVYRLEWAPLPSWWTPCRSCPRRGDSSRNRRETGKEKGWCRSLSYRADMVLIKTTEQGGDDHFPVMKHWLWRWLESPSKDPVQYVLE